MQLVVPYKQQQTPGSCALACLEMVTRYYGCQDLEEVKAYHRLKIRIGRHTNTWGVPNLKVIEEAVRLGFKAKIVSLNPRSAKDMMHSIRGYIGITRQPLIAFHRVSPDSQLGHSRLIVGYEDAAGGAPDMVVYHDPAYATGAMPGGGEYLKWPAQTFADLWHRNQNIGPGQALLISKS